MAARKDVAMAGPAMYERVENDFYPTEAACTKALIEYLRSNSLIAEGDEVLEPAAGDGAIVKVFQQEGFKVSASDLYPQMPGAEVRDFLTFPFHEQEGWHGVNRVVATNPPYAMPWINRFMDRVNDMVHNDGVVGALLMRNEVDCAKTRRVYFADNPYYFGKLVLTWRPRWIPGSTGAPRHNYAWYIWAQEAKYAERGMGPTIHYAAKPKV